MEGTTEEGAPLHTEMNIGPVRLIKANSSYQNGRDGHVHDEQEGSTIQLLDVARQW